MWLEGGGTHRVQHSNHPAISAEAHCILRSHSWGTARLTQVVWVEGPWWVWLPVLQVRVFALVLLLFFSLLILILILFLFGIQSIHRVLQGGQGV